MLRIAALWLAILTIAGDFTGFGQNELVVLPFARQAVQPDWLPADWWLNHNPTYCWLFNQIFGRLSVHLGFEWTAILGRMAAGLLLAIALDRFFRVLELPYVLGLLGSVLFLERQSLVAYEWMAGGLEAKSFAYPLALLAAAFHMGERHLAGFFLLGLALSFHSLVGFFATACTVAALVVVGPGGPWRERFSFLTSSWIFLLSGAIGLLELARGLLPRRGFDATGIWEIYVLDRAPHHLYPPTWQSSPWVTQITLILAFLCATHYLARSRPVRFLTSYLLASLALFMIGIVFWIAGDVPMLRAYWFRFADTMVPLGSLLLAGCWIDRMLRGSTAAPRPRVAPQVVLVERSLTLTAVALGVGLAPRLVTKITFWLDRASWENPSTAPMDRWIQKHTPRDAIFLVSPARDDFYVHAARPVVVNFKASPQQDPVAMREWFDRLQALCPGRPYTGRGFERTAEIRRAFDDLDEDTVRHLRDRFGARYFLPVNDRRYRFPAVAVAGGWVLYEITERE